MSKKKKSWATTLSLMNKSRQGEKSNEFGNLCMTFQMQLELAVCTSPLNRCTALRSSNYCVFLCVFHVIMFIESKKNELLKKNTHQEALRPNVVLLFRGALRGCASGRS
jgi:hypothetical protein